MKHIVENSGGNPTAAGLFALDQLVAEGVDQVGAGLDVAVNFILEFEHLANQHGASLGDLEKFRIGHFLVLNMISDKNTV